MKHVNIYTYSSAKSLKAAEVLNEAVGYVLEFQAKKGVVTRTKTISLGDMHKKMTRNQTEIYVLGMALSRLNTKCELDIYTESQHVANAIEKGWVRNWEMNGWVNAAGKEVANIQEWKELLAFSNEHVIHFHVGEPHPYRRWLENEVLHGRQFTGKR